MCGGKAAGASPDRQTDKASTIHLRLSVDSRRQASRRSQAAPTSPPPPPTTALPSTLPPPPQTLGFVLGTVALGLGFELSGGWATINTANTVHRNLGVACTALGAAQVTAIVLRPQKGSKYRFGWEVRART